ncbi:Pentatricopeptide repeat-containing protein [Raphanus sativus]|uniref:Pentatricopeptide repeat-containing protein At2g03880, mitochondrial n=1 Tax=Raphanus sativus TaxID=3726 RepID=A0A6J0N173_RAPSA|nr:pentatricopeptide repeat-containing protein At2g03880, mitochondrial [Raphanus sativus]KAJ4901165.1 Pentatricopeptide repeat-containing protein [Raphanus sativus]
MKSLTTKLKIIRPVLTSRCSSSSSDQTLLLNEFTRFCYQRDLPKALSAMDTLQSHGLWADSATYSELIKCCMSHRAVHEGNLVRRHLYFNGHQPMLFLANVLINMYVKFNLLNDAHNVFDKMTLRNVVSWTTIISAYSKSKQQQKALELLVSMLREGVRPNVYTYSSVLRSCKEMSDVRMLHCGIIKEGLESDVFVRSALIDVFAKLGEPEDALSVFDEMVTGDAIVWNSIIGGFAQNSKSDEALKLFKRMKRAGFTAEQATLTSVLRACTGLTLLELGMQAHVHIVKYDQDLILNNALVDMYCKCGSLEDARRVFGGMKERDVITWSTMISGLAQNGYSQEALEMFESMKASGTKPNYITIVGVLFACSHAGLLEDGWYYFRSMKKLYGIEPVREHYGCMIDLLGKAGKLDDAVKLLNEMECEPDAVTWRTLLGACRVQGNMVLAEYAAKKVIELDPDDAGTYTVLSNIYANSQKWDSVEEIRTQMRDRGIKKEPGCSWIEVNKKIHAFIIGDESHPLIVEVNKKLNQLIDRMIGIGYVPETNFVLKDLEGEQMEDSLRHHSEKLALAFGLMTLPLGKAIRIRKNLRICGDCHVFFKLASRLEKRSVVIRDPIRYHHFEDGKCSCGDYW